MSKKENKRLKLSRIPTLQERDQLTEDEIDIEIANYNGEENAWQICELTGKLSKAKEILTAMSLIQRLKPRIAIAIKEYNHLAVESEMLLQTWKRHEPGE